MEKLEVIYGRVEYNGKEYMVGDTFECNDVNRIPELVEKEFCKIVTKKEQFKQESKTKQPQKDKNENNKKPKEYPESDE